MSSFISNERTELEGVLKRLAMGVSLGPADTGDEDNASSSLVEIVTVWFECEEPGLVTLIWRMSFSTPMPN